MSRLLAADRLSRSDGPPVKERGRFADMMHGVFECEPNSLLRQKKLAIALKFKIVGLSSGEPMHVDANGRVRPALRDEINMWMLLVSAPQGDTLPVQDIHVYDTHGKWSER